MTTPARKPTRRWATILFGAYIAFSVAFAVAIGVKAYREPPQLGPPAPPPPAPWQPVQQQSLLKPQHYALVVAPPGGDPIVIDRWPTLEVCEHARRVEAERYLAKGVVVPLRCEGIFYWWERIRL